MWGWSKGGPVFFSMPKGADFFEGQNKYVGFHPDTETDFRRRKKLAMDAYQQNKRILESDKYPSTSESGYLMPM